MNQQEQIIYFLGQMKATIECLCSIVMEEGSARLLNLLVEFESDFNRQIKNIFGEHVLI